MFEAAMALQNMAPWEWMGEDDSFGIVDPSTGQLHLGIILGEREGAPGFGLYRGQRGTRFLFREQDDPGSPLYPEVAMEEDSLLLEFVPRKELSEMDLALHEMAGFSPAKPKGRRKRSGLPRFSSRLPAHLPWMPDAVECELMTTALVLAQAFVALVDDDPEFYGDRPYDEVPVYTRVGDRPDSPWKLGWVTLDLSKPAGPPPAEVAAGVVEAALSRPINDQKSWELETYFPPTIVRKPKRPFFPRASIIADAESGRFLDIELSHPEEPEGNHAARCLLETINDEGYRPYALWVGSPHLMEALWPLAESLSLRLRLRSLLRQTPPIREFLAKKFGQEQQAPPSADDGA
jgi:hypothetical protein